MTVINFTSMIIRPDPNWSIQMRSTDHSLIFQKFRIDWRDNISVYRNYGFSYELQGHIYIYIFIYIFLLKSDGSKSGKNYLHLSSKKVGCNSRLAATEGL